MTVLGKKEKREREKAKCYPKNHFIKANIAQFVLGLAQIPEIIGGKERVIGIMTTFLGGKG